MKCELKWLNLERRCEVARSFEIKMDSGPIEYNMDAIVARQRMWLDHVGIVSNVEMMTIRLKTAIKESNQKIRDLCQGTTSRST